MRKYRTKEFSFTEEERSFIDGLLLSDGFINKSNFSLGLNTASKEFAEYVFNSLPKNIWINAGIIKTERYDNRVNKTLTLYRIVTHPNFFFENERKRWYDETGKKRIPNDIKINKTTALTWYLGDGTLSQNLSAKRTSEIKLCTNSFHVEEISTILLEQLSAFLPKIRFKNKQPIICIPRRKIDNFLDFIGPPPFNDYAHKWNVFPYKRKNVEKYGVQYINETTKKNVVLDYTKGEKVSYIAKKYKLCASHVIYFLKKAKIYDSKRDKKVYRLYENGTFVTETKNLKKYCIENNLCYINLLCLCSGKIKKYKNFSIQKI